ncbi:MAG: GNAT family N-acetyltransferase [Actinobacteria bacterium]|nr:GNAT family N-acetyltransferase [Actinomycetota bacterium]
MRRSAAIRRAGAADSRACFAIFRRSLADLLTRLGYRAPGAPPPDPDALWPAYERLFAHLAATCAQWWVAEDAQDGAPLGYARSTQRGATLELTEFFVAPGARTAGVGRALLERAFAPGVGEHRAIIATLDAPAVALYLRFGVAHQSTGVDVTGTPRPVAPPPGYDVAPAALEELLALEQQLLGHAREPDLRFMLADRPAAVLRRGGRAVAYAFECNEHGFAGPVGALEPEHMPAALAHLESAAHAAGLQRLDLTVPLGARTALDWLVAARGFRIDPFYCLFLADGPWARLDRYLPFNPCLML